MQYTPVRKSLSGATGATAAAIAEVTRAVNGSGANPPFYTPLPCTAELQQLVAQWLADMIHEHRADYDIACHAQDFRRNALRNGHLWTINDISKEYFFPDGILPQQLSLAMEVAVGLLCGYMVDLSYTDELVAMVRATATVMAEFNDKAVMVDDFDAHGWDAVFICNYLEGMADGNVERDCAFRGVVVGHQDMELPGDDDDEGIQDPTVYGSHPWVQDPAWVQQYRRIEQFGLRPCTLYGPASQGIIIRALGIP